MCTPCWRRLGVQADLKNNYDQPEALKGVEQLLSAHFSFCSCEAGLRALNAVDSLAELDSESKGEPSARKRRHIQLLPWPNLKDLINFLLIESVNLSH